MSFLPENFNFADILDADVICNSQPISLPSSQNTDIDVFEEVKVLNKSSSFRPLKRIGQQGEFRSTEEIDAKYRIIFTYPYFNLVQSRVIEDALYSDKSMVVCAPTGSGKTVVFEMAIAQLLMDIEDKNYEEDFKIIYMAPVKALCTERLTEWYPKFTKLGLLCIEVTGDTDVEFPQLKPYRVIITTPEKWDMLTRRWRDHRGLVEVVKLFLIDEVHILNDNARGPVLEAVVSRMKTIESSVQSAHRIEQLQKQYGGNQSKESIITPSPRIRFVAVSATVNNPEDVAAWLGTADRPAVYYKFGDECRPVKLKRIVEGYPCPQGTSIFKFDIILNYKLWPIIQKYHNGKPTLIFCNTRKSVALTAEALSREITINFNSEQKAKLMALASILKNKKLQTLILNGVGCHHAGLLFEERMNIEQAFRNRDLPILITTTTLAMGVNLPAHLVIIKNTQQYVNGAYQEYSISTILQMVGRAGRPQFDTEATAVIMTRMADKARYQALVEGTEPLQSFLHKRLAENLNSEAALGTVTDVAQCVQWVNSTFLSVRAAKDPRRYLGLPQAAPANEISKKIEELCVKAMNGLASSGLITMDEASCIESTEAGKLMSVYYIDLETMKLIMKIEGSETLDRLLWLICESHELSDMHLRVDERRCLNALNRSNAAATIRFPMKGKITSRQMKLNCVIQAVLGCLHIPDPSLNQEAMKIMRIALRVCKCLVAYTTRPTSVSRQPKTFLAVINSIVLMKCLTANLWENSPYVSKQLRGIGPAFSMLLASAGKINFLLLEESHPRDLERIMNKGPPAGNIIRKQISLLPKYQITITPIDRDRVQVQLTLINQAYLLENLEHFTAGVNHKSYIIVGDSENYLLYLTSFKDSDLINIYDGCITCEVTRIHKHEHKIMAHCISSSIAGIDMQAEYLFIEIKPLYSQSTENDTNIYKDVSKPINIAKLKIDRKRKGNKNIDLTCSKGKIKRENTLLQNFKYLKESFGKTSNELVDNLNKSTEMSNKIFLNITKPKCSVKDECSDPIFVGTKDNLVNTTVAHSLNKENVFGHLEEENQVNNILSAIEYEMSEATVKDQCIQDQQQQQKILTSVNTSESRRLHKKHVKCNFNIIDILQKETKLDDDNDDIFIDDDIEGFTNTVKFKIDTYLQNVQKSKNEHKDINDVLTIKDIEEIDIKKGSQVQQESIGIQSENNIVDKNSILLQNLEQDSGKEHVKKVFNKIVVKDTYRDLQNKIQSNKMIKSNQESILVTSYKDNTNFTTTLSSAVEGDKRETIQNQNDNSLIMRKDILYSHNGCNYNEITKTLHIFDVKYDSGINIFYNVANETQDLTNTIILNANSDQRFSTLSGSESDISQTLDNNSSCLKYIKQPEMNSNIKVNETLPNLDYKNKPIEPNDFCSSLPVYINDRESGICRESREVETNKPCLTNLSESALQRHEYIKQPEINTDTEVNETLVNLDFKNKPVEMTTTTNDFSSPSIYMNSEKSEICRESREVDIIKPYLTNLSESDLHNGSIGIFKNCDLNYYTSNKTHVYRPINKYKEDATRVNSYYFCKTKFNIVTQNIDKQKVKIISNLKIDFDVTKIVSIYKGNRNVREPLIIDAIKSNCIDNKTTEMELNTKNSNFDQRFSSKLKNNIRENNNYEHTQNSSKGIMKSTVLQTSVPGAQETIPNQFNTKSGNKIENILNKYSIIMKGKLNTTGVPEIKRINNNTISKPPVNWTRRRYKISDIKNLQGTVPKNNMRLNSIHTNTKVVQRGENEADEDYSSDDSASSLITKDISEIYLPVTTTPSKRNSYDINNAPEIVTEVLSTERQTFKSTNVDFNLNKALLNPKTLLNCYNNTEIGGVIPPPPEFADIANLDINTNATKGYTPSSPDYSPEVYHYRVLNNNPDYKIKDVSNIFSDYDFFHGDEESTPSSVRPWTLSPEDNLQDHGNPFLIQNQINSSDVSTNNTKAKLDDYTLSTPPSIHIGAAWNTLQASLTPRRPVPCSGSLVGGSEAKFSSDATTNGKTRQILLKKYN